MPSCTYTDPCFLDLTISSLSGVYTIHVPWWCLIHKQARPWILLPSLTGLQNPTWQSLSMRFSGLCCGHQKFRELGEAPEIKRTNFLGGFTSLQKRDQTQHSTMLWSPRAHSSKSCPKSSTCGSSWVIKMEKAPFWLQGQLDLITHAAVPRHNGMSEIHTASPSSEFAFSWHEPYLRQSTLCVNNIFVTAILCSA